MIRSRRTWARPTYIATPTPATGPLVERGLHVVPQGRPSIAVRLVKKFIGLVAIACGLPLAFAALTLHWLVVPAVGLLSIGLYWILGRSSEY